MRLEKHRDVCLLRLLVGGGDYSGGRGLLHSRSSGNYFTCYFPKHLLDSQDCLLGFKVTQLFNQKRLGKKLRSVT